MPGMAGHPLRRHKKLMLYSMEPSDSMIDKASPSTCLENILTIMFILYRCFNSTGWCTKVPLRLSA